MIFTNHYVENGILNTDLHWFKENLLLETIVGSQMYGTQNEDSDIDFIALVMPKLEHLYPQKFGFILGFDQVPKWERSERKGDSHKQIINKKETEGEWISLVEFFNNAALKGSPGMIEVLFAKRNLVTFGHEIGWMLRDNRRMFLSIKLYHSFRGYAISQLHRIKRGYISGKTDNPKRVPIISKYKYDLKMFSHIIRLLHQIKQILTDGDLDLMRGKEEVKAIKFVEIYYTFEQAEVLVLKRMEELETISLKCNLSLQPQMEPLHNLLQNCLEQFYGNIEKISQTNLEYISTKEVFNKFEELKQLFQRR